MKSLRNMFFLFSLFIYSLALSGPIEDKFVQMEQTQNIKGIYRSGVFTSELPEEYRADNQAQFRLPYALIPLDSPEFRQIKSEDNSIEEFAKNHIVTIKDVKYFKYPFHPATIEYYRNKLDGKFNIIEAKDSEFLVTPTASDRTLVFLEPKNTKYMVKLSLPLKINNRDRILYPTEIRRSVWLTNVFHQIFTKNPDLKNNFFIFDEPFGAYLKINNESFGGISFRKFSDELYNDKREVIPLFSLLSLDKNTGKPIFFEYMSDGENPWDFFENNILKPLLKIINTVTYKEAVSLEFHSQNLVVYVDTEKKKLTGRFGYRDLGSSHLDFYSLIGNHAQIPYFEMILDPERELGGAYTKRTERHWLYFFVKEQVVDLFFIQMAAHGLISREQREEYKKKAWNIIAKNHVKHYKGDQKSVEERTPFTEVFKSVLRNQILLTLRCENLYY